MLAYEFLVLSLLLALPGTVVFLLRPDLRRQIRLMALASLPFALTERFFYPTYWSPRFLFGLIDILGFGIEDVLFVVSLGAFTSTAYAFVARQRLSPLPGAAPRRAGLHAAALIGGAIAGAVMLSIAGLPMIYATMLVMLGFGVFLVGLRRDLILPSILGGLLSAVTYGGLCWIFATLIPGVFTRIWHTDALFDRFVLGIPLEELTYAFLAGMAATAFLPVVSNLRFVSLLSERR